MNTIKLTIAATPDNLRRLAAAFGDKIDDIIGADDVPVVRARQRDDIPAETIKAPEVVPETPKDPTVPEPDPQPVEESTITLADLRGKAIQLTHAGKDEDLAKALADVNAKKLSQVATEDYGRLMELLEAAL